VGGEKVQHLGIILGGCDSDGKSPVGEGHLPVWIPKGGERMGVESGGLEEMFGRVTERALFRGRMLTMRILPPPPPL